MQSTLFLFLSTVLWGFWGLADKYATRFAHPFTLQWMYGLPYIVLLPVWFYLGSRAGPATNLDTRALMWTVLASLASIGAMTLLLFALQFKPASHAMATTAAYPIVTMVLAVLVGSEAFDVRQLAGTVLIVAGIILVQKC